MVFSDSKWPACAHSAAVHTGCDNTMHSVAVIGQLWSFHTWVGKAQMCWRNQWQVQEKTVVVCLTGKWAYKNTSGWSSPVILNRYPAYFVLISPGYVKKKACPRDPGEDCMRCGPEQYVKEAFPKPRCDACVSCAKGLLPHAVILSLYILFALYFYFFHLEFLAAKFSILGYWFSYVLPGT